MENIRALRIPVLGNQRKIRLLIQILVGISTIFGFCAFCNIHSYMPWHLRTVKALARTFEVHSGLWLATLEIQSRWRFLVALILIPSGVGVYFFLWHRSLFTVIAAPVVLGWLLYKVLLGKRFDA
jgi:predicted neutral ceramidase superfamily lipid hydrolase